MAGEKAQENMKKVTERFSTMQEGLAEAQVHGETIKKNLENLQEEVQPRVEKLQEQVNDLSENIAKLQASAEKMKDINK